MMNTLRKRALCLLLALVLALTAAPAALADQSAEAEAEAVQAVVRYGPEAGREELDAALAAGNITPEEHRLARETAEELLDNVPKRAKELAAFCQKVLAELSQGPAAP